MEQTEINTKNWKSLIKPAKLDVQLSDEFTIEVDSIGFWLPDIRHGCKRSSGVGTL